MLSSLVLNEATVAVDGEMAEFWHRAVLRCVSALLHVALPASDARPDCVISPSACLAISTGGFPHGTPSWEKGHFRVPCKLAVFTVKS